jgi:hypothetical protein
MNTINFTLETITKTEQPVKYGMIDSKIVDRFKQVAGLFDIKTIEPFDCETLSQQVYTLQEITDILTKSGLIKEGQQVKEDCLASYWPETGPFDTAYSIHLNIRPDKELGKYRVTYLGRAMAF